MTSSHFEPKKFSTEGSYHNLKPTKNNKKITRKHWDALMGFLLVVRGGQLPKNTAMLTSS